MPLNSLAFLILTAALLIILVHRIFRRLGAAGTSGRLEIQVEDLGGFGWMPLILVSLLSLFTEMLMIRWVSSDVRIFAYFKNFVLVACFLGFGLGCYLCRRRVQLTALVAPLLLLTIILKAPISPLRRSIADLSQLLGGSVEVHTWAFRRCPRAGRA